MKKTRGGPPYMSYLVEIKKKKENPIFLGNTRKKGDRAKRVPLLATGLREKNFFHHSKRRRFCDGTRKREKMGRSCFSGERFFP